MFRWNPVNAEMSQLRTLLLCVERGGFDFESFLLMRYVIKKFTTYPSRLSDFWDILYIDTQNIMERGTNEHCGVQSHAGGLKEILTMIYLMCM